MADRRPLSSGVSPLRRIAFFTDAGRVAGAEIVLALLIAGIDPTVDVAVVGPEPEIVKALAAHRPGRATPVVVPRVRARGDLDALRRQRRTFAALDVDLVHVNLTDMAACLGTIAAVASLRRPRIVVVEHNPFPPQSRFQRFAKIASLRVADAHIAVSSGLAGAVASVTGCDARSITVIHNGVAPAPQVERVQSLPVRLVTVCRLDHNKGVDVLLDAIADVPEVALTVAGDGPERAALEARAERLGLGDRVRFAGWLADIDPLLRDADVFVLGSRDEALPLSILEAMHRGLPVVATSVGGVREAVLDGVTGLVVAPDDPASLARALRTLTDSPGLGRRLGAAGRARARERFTADAMVAAYEAVYRSVASRHGRRVRVRR